MPIPEVPPFPVDGRSSGLARTLRSKREYWSGAASFLQQELDQAEAALIAVLDVQDRRKTDRERIAALARTNSQRVNRF